MIARSGWKRVKSCYTIWFTVEVLTKFVKLSKIFLALALLPASASVITITIYARNESETTLEMDIYCSLKSNTKRKKIRYYNFGDYVTGDGPENDWFGLTSGITANGTAVTEIFLEYGTGVDVDDFYYKGSFSAISYSFSGSATFDLTKVGDFNFGDLVIGS